MTTLQFPRPSAAKPEPRRQVSSPLPLDTKASAKRARRRELVEIFEESVWTGAGVLTGYGVALAAAVLILLAGVGLGAWLF